MDNLRPSKIREKIQLYKGAKPEYKILNVKYVGRYAEFYDTKGKAVGSIQISDFQETMKKKGVWKRYGTSAVSFKKY